MQFNVGDLLLKEKPQQTFQGIIVEFDVEVCVVEWYQVPTGHADNSTYTYEGVYYLGELSNLIKAGDLKYYPVVK
jgi:hypothetical protein